MGEMHNGWWRSQNATIPILNTHLFIQRSFVAGIAASGVKG
jgi:ABC-type glycerol-3-phosphate transport system permease component